MDLAFGGFEMVEKSWVPEDIYSPGSGIWT
jgi:hypothetical protein